MAHNFINGPITGMEVSNGIKVINPIKQHKIPANGPKIKKHAIQIIEIGSNRANPWGTRVRSISGLRIGKIIADNAPKIAAPANSINNCDELLLAASFSPGFFFRHFYSLRLCSLISILFVRSV